MKGSKTLLAYDVLLEEIDALAAILPRIEDSLQRGADFLVGNLAPKGPILSTRNLSFCHKVAWGLYEAGRIQEVIRILDWIDANARRAPGEYYFPDEQWYEKDMQRVYRALTFGKVAEYLRHPAFANDEVRARLCEYQHPSGGVAANIDAGFPERLEPLNTTFFGEWALAAGLLDQAKKAGDWVVELVDLNRKHLKEDQPLFYYTRERSSGRLVRNIPRGQRMNYMIDARTVKQPSWVSGTCMALLADVYSATGERKYLDAALELARYEGRCDPAQLFWPSKCKVCWGAAQLYRLTMAPEHRKTAANVARVTFMAAQRQNGGWPHLFYPLRETGAWRKVVYADPKVEVPEKIKKDGSYCWLSGYELTGEFLGELGCTLKSFREVLAHLRARKQLFDQNVNLAH